MRKQDGFSLIELLIVVAILLILAAIAIPNLLQARIASNESSAAASLRTINTAELAYAAAFPSTGYPAALGILGGPEPCTFGPATACLIDGVLSSGSKSGYNFTAIGGMPVGGINTQFVSNAVPSSPSTGIKGFCGTEDNTVRFVNPAGPIVTHDPCLLLTPVGR